MQYAAMQERIHLAINPMTQISHEGIRQDGEEFKRAVRIEARYERDGFCGKLAASVVKIGMYH
jgi:hypothetical protein